MASCRGSQHALARLTAAVLYDGAWILLAVEPRCLQACNLAQCTVLEVPHVGAGRRKFDLGRVAGVVICFSGLPFTLQQEACVSK